jgi:hypothetical protein
MDQLMVLLHFELVKNYLVALLIPKFGPNQQVDFVLLQNLVNFLDLKALRLYELM